MTDKLSIGRLGAHLQTILQHNRLGFEDALVNRDPDEFILRLAAAGCVIAADMKPHERFLTTPDIVARQNAIIDAPGPTDYGAVDAVTGASANDDPPGPARKRARAAQPAHDVETGEIAPEPPPAEPERTPEEIEREEALKAYTLKADVLTGILSQPEAKWRETCDRSKLGMSDAEACALMAQHNEKWLAPCREAFPALAARVDEMLMRGRVAP